MKFLVDEGVDRSVVSGLRKSGYDVYYVIEEARASDDEFLLELARTDNRILIRLEGYDTEERGEMVCKLISKYESQLQNSFSVIQRGVIRIR